MAYEELEGKESSFNEALLKMVRIHELQKTVNDHNINPVLFYPEENIYGYQVIFNSLRQLFAETYSKLSTKLRDEGLKKIGEIEESFEKNKIHVLEENQVTHNKGMILKKENWKIMKLHLFKLDLLVRDYLEKTGYSSPNADDYDGL